jgi:hypothetical protein
MLSKASSASGRRVGQGVALPSDLGAARRPHQASSGRFGDDRPEGQLERRSCGDDGRRGYGWNHQKARARIARVVNAGGALCARCHRPILPGEPWDLGHHSRYAGPEHRRCNRATNRTRRPSCGLETGERRGGAPQRPLWSSRALRVRWLSWHPPRGDGRAG